MIGQFVPTYSDGNAQFVPMSSVIFDGTIVSKQMGVMDSDLNSQVGPQGDIEQDLEYMVFKTTGQVGSAGTLESLLAPVDGQLGGQVGPQGGIEQTLEHMMSEISGQVGSAGTLESQFEDIRLSLIGLLVSERVYGCEFITKVVYGCEFITKVVYGCEFITYREI